MYCEWDTKQSFDEWHDALCVQLGYPKIGYNQATGLPDENAQKTVAYTEPFEIESKWVAWVDDQYADNLQVTDLRRPQPERFL